MGLKEILIACISSFLVILFAVLVRVYALRKVMKEDLQTKEYHKLTRRNFKTQIKRLRRNFFKLLMIMICGIIVLIFVVIYL